MDHDQIDFLENVLKGIDKMTNGGFTGLGLIIYKDIKDIPVSPLRQSNPNNFMLPINDEETIKKKLLVLSNFKSTYHDGFHLISIDKSLTHICQYFSPPIHKGVIIDYTKGGRYRAAQYGSCLESVIAIGIIGEVYGPHIFIKGETHKL